MIKHQYNSKHHQFTMLCLYSLFQLIITIRLIIIIAITITIIIPILQTQPPPHYARIQFSPNRSEKADL